MSDVFLSYSRRDAEFVARLRSALESRSISIFIDTEDLAPASRFADELKSAIEGADSFAFVMSPDSLASEECGRELKHASSINKRIIPIMARACDKNSIPHVLSDLNFVPQIGLFADRFEESVSTLVEAITTDLTWVHMHTVLGQKAIEWDSNNRDRSFLLSGSELDAAESWIAQRSEKNPQPTDLQAEFVLESRRRSTRRLRQTRGLVSIALAVALALSAVALVQRNTAEANQRTAQSEDMAAEATNLFDANPALGMLLSVQAFKRAPTEQARSAAIQAVEQTLNFSLNQGEPVRSLAFSPNGRYLAVGDVNGHVGLWNSATGKRISTFSEKSTVTSVAFSQDSKTVAVGDASGHVGLWDTATGTRTGRLNAQGPVKSIAYNPINGILAVGDSNGHVGLWNTSTQRQIKVIREGSSVNSVAVSPNGSILAVGDSSGNVGLWNTASNVLVRTYPEGSPVTSVAFDPEGLTLAVGDRSGNVGLWDVSTSQRRDVPVGGGAIVGVALKANELLAVNSDGDLGFWATSNLAETALYAQDTQATAVAAGPNGIIAFGDAEGHVSSLTGEGLHKWVLSLEQPGIQVINSLALSPNDEALVVGDASGLVGFIDATNGKLVGTVSKFGVPSTRGVEGLAFSRSSRFLAVTFVGGAVALFDFDNSHTVPLPQPDNVTSTAFASRGETLATGGTHGRVSLWNATTRKRIGVVGTVSGNSPVTSIAFSPNGRILAAGTKKGAIGLWKIATHTRLATFSEGSPVTSMAFAPDSLVLAAGDSGGDIGLWNTATDQRSTLSEGSPVTSVAFSPKGRTLAAGDNSSEITIWDTVRDIPTAILPDVIGSRVTSVAFSPNGESLVSGDSKGDILIVRRGLWNLSSGQMTQIVCGRVRWNMTPAEWTAFVPNQSYQEVCPG